jgi:hypothetical protein
MPEGRLPSAPRARRVHRGLPRARQPCWPTPACPATCGDTSTGRRARRRGGAVTVGLGFDEELYRAVREFADTPEAATLTGENARLLKHTLRDCRRNGFELAAGDRERLRLLFEELVELGSRFMEAIAGWQDGIEVDRATWSSGTTDSP